MQETVILQMVVKTVQKTDGTGTIVNNDSMEMDFDFNGSLVVLML